MAQEIREDLGEDLNDTMMVNLLFRVRKLTVGVSEK